MLEALPPSTRFNALFFERTAAPLFPLVRPATREAIEAFEAEIVPNRLHNGTDLSGALKAAGGLCCARRPPSGRACWSRSSPTGRCRR